MPLQKLSDLCRPCPSVRATYRKRRPCRREKVADLFSADDDIYAHRIAPPQRRLHAIQRGGDRRNFSARTGNDLGLRFFANSERCGQFRLTSCARLQRRLRRRHSEDVYGKRPALQKPSVSFSCAASSFAVGTLCWRRENDESEQIR